MSALKMAPQKNRMRLKDRNNPIEKNVPDFLDEVSIPDAIIFIANRIKNPTDIFEKQVELVKKRVDYALKCKTLVSTNKQYLRFDHLIFWIKTKKNWTQKFGDLNPPNVGQFEGTIGFSVAASGTALPSDLNACQSMLARLLVENHSLRQINETQLKEISRLKPFEAKVEKQRMIGEKSGKLGKGIKKEYS